MRYPVESASVIPGSGSAIYLYLMDTVEYPGKLPHELWYDGLEKSMEDPASTPFRGFYPKGETLRIKYGGAEEFADHTFTGEEKNVVFVGDLSKEAMMKLAIPKNSDETEKVFNPNFVAFEALSEEVKASNNLPGLALAKSFSSWLSNKKNPYYTEQDVVDFLLTATEYPSSDEMMYILHGNHITWCTHRFIYYGIEPDVKKQFYSHNSPDFYVKDIGTIMPAILYVFANLGVDPVEVIKTIPYDLWGIDKVAETIKKNVTVANAA